MSLALILEPQKLLVWDSDFPVSAHIAFQLAVSPERRATFRIYREKRQAPDFQALARVGQSFADCHWFPSEACLR